MKNKDNVANSNGQDVVSEYPKGTDHIIIEIVDYAPNAVISRTIIKKITGNITAMSFSEGEELNEKTLPFDTYVQIVDGAADLTIEGKLLHLKRGTGIVVPAHSLHRFDANQKFKMISTVIKSGYEY